MLLLDDESSEKEEKRDRSGGEATYQIREEERGKKSFCEPIEIQTPESCELFISSLQPGNLSLNFYNTTHLRPFHKVLYCSINGASVGELRNTFLQFSNSQRHYGGEYYGID